MSGISYGISDWDVEVELGLRLLLGNIYRHCKNITSFVGCHGELLIGLDLTLTPISSHLGYSLHSINPKNQVLV